MATEYHTGGNSLADANWSGDGIDDTDGLVFRDSNRNITEGLDTTGSTTAGIYWIRVERTFTANIGTASTSAQFEFDASFTGQSEQIIYLAGGGTFYLSPSTTLASLTINSAGTVSLTGGTVTNVYLTNGRLIVGASATVTNLYQKGGSVEFEDGSSGTLLEQWGGRALTDRAFATVNTGGSGGVLTLRSKTNDYTTINHRGTSRIRLLRGGATTVNVYNGTWDESAAEEAATLATFNRYNGASVIRNDGLVTHTADNEIGSPIIGDTGFDEPPGAI